MKRVSCIADMPRAVKYRTNTPLVPHDMPASSTSTVPSREGDFCSMAASPFEISNVMGIIARFCV